jgi:hypothetical protein
MKAIRFLFIIIILSTTALAQSVSKEKQTFSKLGKDVPKINKVYLSGKAKLVGGKAYVKFESELSKTDEIAVIVTPINSWSGIYVKNVTKNGFEVNSETGDLNAEFYWIVVGKEEKGVFGIKKY